MPYNATGTLTTDKREVAVEETWDSQSDWTAYQSASRVQINNGVVSLSQFSPPDSVQARFKFEQDLTDSVGTYDATHSGTASYTTDAKQGSYALDKSGSNYVEIPYDVDESSWAWIGWVKWNADGPWLDNRDGNFDGAGRVSMLNGNTISAKSDNWTNSMTTSGAQGTWYHIVYQYANGTAELYKNGSQADSMSPSNPPGGRANLYIGKSGGSLGGGAAVVTDDVMIANSPLSSDQINNIYETFA